MNSFIEKQNNSSFSSMLSAIPKAIDKQDSKTAISIFLSLFTVIFLFPTGILDSNETFYFMLANLYWDTQHEYSALIETSSHLFPFAILTGAFTKLMGYEMANAALLLLSACFLSIGFARLISYWKLSSLDALIIVATFIAFGQQHIHFGGEWIFRDFEGKVVAYIFVFFGLAKALESRWIAMVLSMAVATYFHFLVGGFWTIIALIWLYTTTEPKKKVLFAFLSYSAMILPLIILILSQRIGTPSVIDGLDTSLIYADRVSHHVHPFSSIQELKKWLPGAVALLGCIMATCIILPVAPDCKNTKTLLYTVLGLQTYLFIAFIASASETFVSIFGSFFVFRPASFTLLLTITLAVLIYRKLTSFRLPLWAAFFVILPIAVWPALEAKRGEIRYYLDSKAEIDLLVSTVDSITENDEVVLLDPVRDGRFPETRITRLMPRPTLADYKIIPTESTNLVEWYQRMEYRNKVFLKGCDQAYPLGALVFRNERRPSITVIESCGPIVFEGENYSVIDINP